MPAKDLYHDAARNALIKDGWTITHDPLTLPFGNRDVFVDLAAERFLAAERGSERIAFLAVRRQVYDSLFQEPVGQLLIRNRRLRLFVFDSEEEVAVRWLI